MGQRLVYSLIVGPAEDPTDADPSGRFSLQASWRDGISFLLKIRKSEKLKVATLRKTATLVLAASYINFWFRSDDFKDISDEEMRTWMEEERIQVIDVEDEDDTTAKKTNEEDDDEEPEIA